MNEVETIRSRHTPLTVEEKTEEKANSDRVAMLRARSKTRRIPVCPEHGVYLVYRAYSEEGELLYIGATMSFESRMAFHRGEGWWLSEVDERNTTIEVFPNMEETAAREMQLIRDLQPAMNTAGVTSHALPYRGPRAVQINGPKQKSA